MDASWAYAKGYARPRKKFRLSDFMPVLADSSLSLSTGPSFRKSQMASPCEEDIRAAAASAAAAAAGSNSAHRTRTLGEQPQDTTAVAVFTFALVLKNNGARTFLVVSVYDEQ
ncbi:uncharacterized protein LOC144132258 [Amblyomma americanum]